VPERGIIVVIEGQPACHARTGTVGKRQSHFGAIENACAQPGQFDAKAARSGGGDVSGQNLPRHLAEGSIKIGFAGLAPNAQTKTPLSRPCRAQQFEPLRHRLQLQKRTAEAEEGGLGDAFRACRRHVPLAAEHARKHTPAFQPEPVQLRSAVHVSQCQPGHQRQPLFSDHSHWKCVSLCAFCNSLTRSLSISRSN